jgi:uncharacterized protein (TIGR00730 family)
LSQNHQSRVIVVFGSHAPQPGSADYEVAREVGQRLAEAEFTVATGGYGGTMAAASQGAAEAGGRVIGVTSRQVEKTRPATLNRWVNEEIQYESLVERVAHLVKHNQGMIVMPGGIGTLSELALAWSLMQVQEINRRPLILFGQAWADMIGNFANLEYVAHDHHALIHYAGTPAEAIDVLLETLIVLNEEPTQSVD